MLAFALALALEVGLGLGLGLQLELELELAPTYTYIYIYTYYYYYYYYYNNYYYPYLDGIFPQEAGLSRGKEVFSLFVVFQGDGKIGRFIVESQSAGFVGDLVSLCV